MKKKKLVACLVSLNLLLIGFVGYLWTMQCRETFPSPAVRQVMEKESLLSATTFGNRHTSSNGEQAGTLLDNASEQSLPPQPNQQLVETPDVEKVSMPLVFLEPDPKINLTAEEMVRWNNLRESFIKAIGGIYQNPSDPQYLQRWQKAQPQVEEEFRAAFGDEIYRELQDKADRQAMQQ